MSDLNGFSSFFVGNTVIGEFAGVAFTGTIFEVNQSSVSYSHIFHIELTAPMVLPNEYPFNGKTVSSVSVRMDEKGEMPFAGNMRHAPVLDFSI